MRFRLACACAVVLLTGCMSRTPSIGVNQSQMTISTSSAAAPLAPLPEDLYPVPWKYYAIPDTEFSLPLPLGAELHSQEIQGAVKETTVYTGSASSPKPWFFGIAFRNCMRGGTCPGGGFGFQEKSITNPEQAMTVKEFLTSDRENSQLLWRNYVMTFANNHKYVGQYIPDHDFTNERLAFTVLTHARREKAVFPFGKIACVPEREMPRNADFRSDLVPQFNETSVFFPSLIAPSPDIAPNEAIAVESESLGLRACFPFHEWWNPITKTLATVDTIGNSIFFGPLVTCPPVGICRRYVLMRDDNIRILKPLVDARTSREELLASPAAQFELQKLHWDTIDSIQRVNDTGESTVLLYRGTWSVDVPALAYRILYKDRTYLLTEVFPRYAGKGEMQSLLQEIVQSIEWR